MSVGTVPSEFPCFCIEPNKAWHWEHAMMFLKELPVLEYDTSAVLHIPVSAVIRSLRPLHEPGTELCKAQ